eukprot:2870890-Prymnesium_polylepis.1
MRVGPCSVWLRGWVRGRVLGRAARGGSGGPGGPTAGEDVTRVRGMGTWHDGARGEGRGKETKKRDAEQAWE